MPWCYVVSGEASQHHAHVGFRRVVAVVAARLRELLKANRYGPPLPFPLECMGATPSF